MAVLDDDLLRDVESGRSLSITRYATAFRTGAHHALCDCPADGLGIEVRGADHVAKHCAAYVDLVLRSLLRLRTINRDMRRLGDPN